MKNEHVFCLTLLLPALMIFPVFGQTTETITIATYYPSPNGVYQELKVQKMVIGDNYYDSSYCWPPTACANQIDAGADLVVEGNVGIGTTTLLPAVALQIAHPAVPLIFRETDAGAGLWRMPLDNGTLRFDVATGGVFTLAGMGVLSMTSSGNVGINTLGPQADLEVNSVLRLTPSTTYGHDTVGGVYYDSNAGVNSFKYRDNVGWKKIGGATLGAARLQSGADIDRNGRGSTPPTYTPDVNCNANEVVVGIRVAVKNKCPSDCGFNRGARLYRVDLYCAPLQ